MRVILRKGTDADAGLIVSYLKKLAEYEKLGDLCNITEETLIKLLEEPNGLSAVIAEYDAAPVGFMTYYFYKIATFSGKRVMYIEDIFVDDAYRKCGIGGTMFDFATKIALENNCARLEWKCLDWNISAQKFYNKIGGNCSKDQWLTYTIEI
ncbi:MAG: GNAT family N-acetyltransferase [Oscillospiraceae bacterium]|nr:GNAT family N-acetyltransferase [Oscillospiraceae bacterium]